MNSQKPELQILRCFAVMIAVCGFTSCAGVGEYFRLPEMSVLPNEIPRKASPATVRALMGEPQWTEVKKLPRKSDKSSKDAKSDLTSESVDVLHVWHYTDHWWKDDGFASWDVFFCERPAAGPQKKPLFRYVGWRMTDPPSAETGSREVFNVPWD